jgi:hypothetical protein
MLLGGLLLATSTLAGTARSGADCDTTAYSCDDDVRLVVHFDSNPGNHGPELRVYRDDVAALGDPSLPEIPPTSKLVASIPTSEIEQTPEGGYVVQVEESGVPDGVHAYFITADEIAVYCPAVAVVDATGRPCPTGGKCNKATCSAGEYCCNPSCSYCAGMSEGCLTIACTEDTQPEAPPNTEGSACSLTLPLGGRMDTGLIAFVVIAFAWACRRSMKSAPTR